MSLGLEDEVEEMHPLLFLIHLSELPQQLEHPHPQLRAVVMVYL